ncbi:type VI secretion system Vgr family protein [Viridibacterium curvum]|uniref:Type VI secretion system spike protein VgrG1b n=1 Tax=Viridibacterium curvum TaxID=1101404 RepID=A0ABP9QNF9_9RHOO
MADESQFQLITPLGSALRLHKIVAREKLCHISQFEAECLSEQADLDIDKILGQMVSVRIALPDLSHRYLCGYVTRFAHSGTRGRFQTFQCVIHAWPWFLTRTTDCRIFQQRSVPDIIKDVFADHGAIAEFRNDLTGTYEPRDYCVQYRESDFDFVCRLMEEEGIYFFFEHDENKNTLVLADSVSAHNPVPGFGTINFVSHGGSRRDSGDYITDWHFAQAVQSGKTRIIDYDFERPSVKLDAKAAQEQEHEHADLEQFDYPGGFVKQPHGDHYARVRIDELHSQFEQARARTSVRAAGTGMLFKLDGHVRSEQNREYLILATTMHMQAEGYEADGTGGSHFSSELVVLPSSQQFRPVRRTPQPVVKGPHTAVVVGPSGSEIYTDKYGRVKVQFHWDRLGKKDENSSCWVRVSFPWAGKQWGFVSIPRIGHEVVVEFLEGNPDRPLITGSVYNAEQMPPYALPDNMTQSGIKTRSSTGGSADNFNEIRFEDKKGSEQVYIHAEKNLDSVIENNETRDIGNDRTTTIGHDDIIEIKNNRNEKVSQNEFIEIGNNRTEIVGGNEQIEVRGDRTETVFGNEDVLISGNRTHNVSGNNSLTVIGNDDNTITGNQSNTVTGSITETVTGSVTQTVTGSVMMSVTAGLTINSVAPMTINAPAGYTLNTPTSIVETTPAKIGFLGFGMEYNGAKMEYTGLATAMKAADVSIVAGLALDMAAIKTENEPLKIGNIASEIKTNGLKATLAGLFVLT